MLVQQKKNEIIQYFISYKNTWAVISSKGEIDLTVIIWVKDNYEFYQFWSKTLDLYEDNFTKKIISLYIQTIDYKKTYLLNRDEKENREHYKIISGTEKTEIDEIDYRLLNELAINARSPLVELAEKFNISSQSITYRINNLIKKDIIKAFRVNIDYSKLGLQHHKIDIYLKEHKQRMSIIEYLTTKPCLQCLNVAIGWADIEMEIVIKDISEIDNIINELNSKFPNSIRKHTFWIGEKVHKERWLPVLEF